MGLLLGAIVPRQAFMNGRIFVTIIFSLFLGVIKLILVLWPFLMTKPNSTTRISLPLCHQWLQRYGTFWCQHVRYGLTALKYWLWWRYQPLRLLFYHIPQSHSGIQVYHNIRYFHVQDYYARYGLHHRFPMDTIFQHLRDAVHQGFPHHLTWNPPAKSCTEDYRRR